MIKGVVSRVSARQNRYGWFIGLCINDQWYNVSSKTNNSDSYKDRLVTFDFTTNAKGYHDVTMNTLKVAEAPTEAQPVKTTATTYSTNKPAYETGIKVGHAINNATQLAIAQNGNKTTLQHIRSIAEKFVGLSLVLEHDYAALASNAKQAINTPVSEFVNHHEDDIPQDVKAATRGRKPKPQAVETQDDDDFNDDLPFN